MTNNNTVGTAPPQRRTVSFRINFDWGTNLVRDLWAEGRYSTALETLRDFGVPDECHAPIIHGAMRMVQDPDGRDGVDGMTVEDNWNADLGRCHHGLYPEYTDIWDVALNSMKYKALYINEMKPKLRMMLDQRERNEWERGAWADEQERIISAIPDEVYEALFTSKSELGVGARVGNPAPFLQVDDMLDQYVSSTLAAEKAHVEPQEFEWKLQPNPLLGGESYYVEGWLSPGGLWYPHGYGQHGLWASKLCDEFGTSEDGLSDQDALLSHGWLSLHAATSYGGFLIVGWAQEITREQREFFLNGTAVLEADDEQLDFYDKTLEGFRAGGRVEISVSSTSPHIQSFLG